MPAVADGEVPSTSHMVAVDSRGNVASVTSTIEGAFGSGLTSNGYFLNNELTDFHRARGERPAGRQPRRRRQEAAQLDVADHRLRTRRQDRKSTRLHSSH